MKKILVLVMLLIYSAIPAMAVNLFYDENTSYYNEDEQGNFTVNPKYKVFDDYINNYYKKLYDNFNPKGKFTKFSREYVYYSFLIKKNGEIEKFRIYDSSLENIEYLNPIFLFHERYFNKKEGQKFIDYTTDVIMKNLPDKFPEEIEHEYLDIQVVFFYTPLAPVTYTRIKKDGIIDFNHFACNCPNNVVFYPRWDIKIFKK